ncbi:DUF1311 domain-containing protein [Primorskyibacter aestuariivivens]|uniref:lysozyme inhibitor LprI family protein n=1 Tax=Primorskyibacter aestuariivivens TaxID=1888912 RepID=UPI002300140F|nr:lysozyme inhibitor LprI family protein [Primorskyibacter aestuariivivens]MDA7428708.1 DUF1311 domain-containing protein [Primorskyibacter aestuariivivens]
MTRILTSLLLALGTAVPAQELVFSPAETEACLIAGGGAECIGQSADACVNATPGGYSTVGMGACLDQEWQYWDARLNAAFQSVLNDAKAMDAEMDELGSAAPKQAPALRDMQRAWIGFRDLKCAYEASTWGGGTGAGPAAIQCMMETTGRQALYLEAPLPE